MRDTITQKYFNWKVEVEYEVPLIINNKRLTDRQIAQLFGAMDGSKIKIFKFPKDDAYFIHIDNPYYTSIRKIYKDQESNDWVMQNISLEIIPNEQKKHYGTRILGYQVKNASKWGIKRILTTAARDIGQNGYYTWPVLGFNGLIPDEIKGNLPKNLIFTKDVQELIDQDNGLETWKEYGNTIDVEFDLNKKSESYKILQKYLSIKRIKL